MGYRIPDDVLSQRLDQATLLLDLRTGTYLKLNPSGTFIWELLGNGAEREGIAAALAERFSLDTDRAAHDTDAILADLLERNLLESVE